MKRKAIALGRLLWIATLILGTLTPALCGLICPPSSSEIPSEAMCERCAMARSHRQRVTLCIEGQSRVQTATWHKTAPASPQVLAHAILTTLAFELEPRSAGASRNWEAVSDALHERDVGANRPRAPPISCV